MKNLIYNSLLCSLIMGVVVMFVGCDKSAGDEATKLGVKIAIELTTDSSISFQIESANATEVRYIVAKASEGMCNAEQILADGKSSKINEAYTVKVYNLERNTPYLIAVAAKNSKGVEVAYEIATTASQHYDEVALDFGLVRRLLDEQYADTDFALLFTDVNPECELTLVFNAEPGEMLPEGSYTTDGGINAGIDAKRSFISFADGSEPIYFDRVDVEVDIPYQEFRDRYSISASLYAGDTLYKVEIYDYVGDMPHYDISQMEFNCPDIRKREQGKRATIAFNTLDGKATLVLEAHLVKQNEMYLEPGQYSVNNAEVFAAGDIEAHNSWFIANGTYGELASGTVNISINDEYEYMFDVDVVDALGREVRFEYCGALPEMTFKRDFTLDSITISEDEIGRYHIDFGGHHTLSLDIYAEELAEGDYPIVDAAGAQVPYVDVATLRFGTPLGEIAIKGGEMRILLIDDDLVEISFELRARDDYYIWKGKYYGAI
ncbi:MAG: hypothetical protein IKU96_05745 [Alistipes sp.]|nr:hypothetical protein [Alistipes sp.]